MSKVIGHRMGAFEGERRKEYKEDNQSDAGTICKQKWINQGVNKEKPETYKLFNERGLQKG